MIFVSDENHIFNSISTPAGKFRFIKASIILGVGDVMSIILLWVRISNCSREVLSIKEDLLTVYLCISVGKGTGPTGFPPYLSMVSTICRADLSIILLS